MRLSPWATLVLGLMIGTAIGYIAGELQPVAPGSVSSPSAVRTGSVPEGHPPLTGGDAGTRGRRGLAERAAELERRLEHSPDDPELLVSLGNLYFDAGRWQEAGGWYERAVEHRPDDPNVLTDLAVVYRNLDRPERALELLDRSIELDPGQWQAMYNKVVVLGVDLARRDEAVAVLEKLREIEASNPEVPDLDDLESSISG